jgi:hypothetical protein
MQRIRRPAANTANKGAGVASPLSRDYSICVRGVGTRPSESRGSHKKLASACVRFSRPLKADIADGDRHVRFVAKADSCTAAINISR